MVLFTLEGQQQLVNSNDAYCDRLRTQSLEARERISRTEKQIDHTKERLACIKKQKDRFWELRDERNRLEGLLKTFESEVRQLDNVIHANEVTIQRYIDSEVPIVELVAPDN